VKEEPYRFANRPFVLRCRSCSEETSLTAGTIMHKTHTPICTWFWGAYLATTQTPGISALGFQRQLGIPRYETAYQMLHKLRSAMIRPDRDMIGGQYPVEVDETFIGGRTRGEGRGVHHKAIVVAGVEERRGTRDGPQAEGRRARGLPVAGGKFAGRLRMRLILDRGREPLEAFVAQNIARGSVIRTDGWQGYDRLGAMGYDYRPLVIHGDPERTEAHLPMIHIVFSNLKTWLMGTHHGVSQHHLQAYLNEFVFRFNRRFYPMTNFATVLGIGPVTTSPTYLGLYSGEYVHPNPTGSRPVRRRGRRLYRG